MSAELTKMIQNDGWLAIKRLLRLVLHHLRYFTVNEDYVHSANPTVSPLTQVTVNARHDTAVILCKQCSETNKTAADSFNGLFCRTSNRKLSLTGRQIQQ